jgi:hypothetical protein
MDQSKGMHRPSAPKVLQYGVTDTVSCKIGFVLLRLKKFRAQTTPAILGADTVPVCH